MRPAFRPLEIEYQMRKRFCVKDTAKYRTVSLRPVLGFRWRDFVEVNGKVTLGIYFYFLFHFCSINKHWFYCIKTLRHHGSFNVTYQAILIST